MYTKMFNIIQSRIGLNLANLLKHIMVNPTRNAAKEAVIPIVPPKVYLFDASKLPTEVTVTREEALKTYENMFMIRRMEMEAADLYKAKQIFGFCHLYIGTEAVATGLFDALQPVDDVITSYRCHGWAMLFLNRLGKDGVKMVLSELTGRAEGAQKGKGGSMHIYVPPHFHGGQAIVGGQVPLGTGLAFAHMYKEDKGVSVSLYGDGAANQGQVFEAFNIAALLKLPAVFVCENNMYGMGTSANRSSSSTDYYMAGRIIPGVLVDGMDIFTVREVSRAVFEHCRSGSGPVVMEMNTYRYHGHSMSDPGVSYRSREEVEEVRKTRDPIKKLKTLILEHDLATEEEIKEIDKRVRKVCKEAKEASTKGTIPAEGELYTEIYVKYLEQPRKCIVKV